MAKTNGAAGAGMTKREGVRRALAALGDDTPPARIREYLQKTFRITMTNDHISNAKSEILAKARAGAAPTPPAAAAPVNGAQKPGATAPRQATPPRKPAAKPAAPRPAARVVPQSAPAPKANSGPAGLSVDDVRTMRRLVARHGAATLKGLIDVLS